MRVVVVVVVVVVWWLLWCGGCCCVVWWLLLCCVVVVVGGLVVGRIVDAVCFPGVWSPPLCLWVLARGCGGGVGVFVLAC